MCEWGNSDSVSCCVKFMNTRLLIKIRKDSVVGSTLDQKIVKRMYYDDKGLYVKVTNNKTGLT